jgi:hypothetical protein
MPWARKTRSASLIVLARLRQQRTIDTNLSCENVRKWSRHMARLSVVWKCFCKQDAMTSSTDELTVSDCLLLAARTDKHDSELWTEPLRTAD